MAHPGKGEESLITITHVTRQEGVDERYVVFRQLEKSVLKILYLLIYLITYLPVRLLIVSRIWLLML